jgi:hypothetical protein
VSPKGDFCYTLRVPTTVGLVWRLAEIITTCRGHGTQNLRLFTEDGQEMTEWKEALGVESVLVNPMYFEALALKNGF